MMFSLEKPELGAGTMYAPAGTTFTKQTSATLKMSNIANIRKNRVGESSQWTMSCRSSSYTARFLECSKKSKISEDKIYYFNILLITLSMNKTPTTTPPSTKRETIDIIIFRVDFQGLKEILWRTGRQRQIHRQRHIYWLLYRG